MSKHQQCVASILIVTAIVPGLFMPMLLVHTKVTVAAEPPQVKRVHLDTAVATSAHLGG
ncbi:MAG TPA: hypothetical protein PLZ61_00050 [Candidatus Cryosericum sp.]|nr:hypothetical protein [Candidatus Cryosericum sp.]